MRRRIAPVADGAKESAPLKLRCEPRRHDGGDEAKKRARMTKGMTVRDVVQSLLFLLLLVAPPTLGVYYLTPFFVFENVRCRLTEKVWPDATVTAMNRGYAARAPFFRTVEYSKAMMWGTYNPHRIFAMSTRSQQPVEVGIAWYDARQDAETAILRHRRTSIFEAGLKVVWLTHDGSHYGHQHITDRALKTEIEVEFLKSPAGGAWHVRVHGKCEGGNSLVLVIYVINESGKRVVLKPPMQGEEVLWNPEVRSEFTEWAGGVQRFTVRIRDDPNPFAKSVPWSAEGVDTTPGAGWRLNVGNPPANRTEKLVRDGEARPATGLKHNVMILRKRYSEDFRLEMSMSVLSQLRSEEVVANGEYDAEAQYEALSTCQLVNTFRTREKQLQERINMFFSAGARNFSAKPRLYLSRALRSVSAGFGTLGFSSGRYLQLTLPSSPSVAPGQPYADPNSVDEVLTTTSRYVSSFGLFGTAEPSGALRVSFELFGLQLLFLQKWNVNMAMDMIANWFVTLQDPETGFIPPHVILSEEGQSLIADPATRWHHPHHASAPTVVVALQQMLGEAVDAADSRSLISPAELDAFLELILPHLRRYRDWLHRTQLGGDDIVLQSDNKTSPVSYRWRSRSGHSIPASGMPDYPRPVCPGEEHAERHVDLFSWIAALSILISDVEDRLGMKHSVQINWQERLDQLHWDSASQRYADVVGCNTREFSPIVGYANLYPFMLGILENKERAMATLQLAIRELHVQYGLMSASFSSVRLARERNIRHDNRWAGPIWLSANVLFLNALKTKYVRMLGSEAAQYYEELRYALVERLRVHAENAEYYNPVTGKGEGRPTETDASMLYTLLLQPLQ